MLLRQFDELAVQAEVLIDVLYEQLIGQQSRSYCGDMRERRPIGHAMLPESAGGRHAPAKYHTVGVAPPSIRTVVPVKKSLSGLAMKQTAAAMSFG